jgi:hypothetical protein
METLPMAGTALATVALAAMPVHFFVRWRNRNV